MNQPEYGTESFVSNNSYCLVFFPFCLTKFIKRFLSFANAEFVIQFLIQEAVDNFAGILFSCFDLGIYATSTARSWAAFFLTRVIIWLAIEKPI